MKYLSITASLILSLHAPQLWALTEAQKEEFAKTQSITVYNQEGAASGIFEVYLPKQITNLKITYDAYRDQTHATLTNLVERDKRWYNKCFHQVKNRVGFLNQETFQDGLCAIPDDYSATKAKNAQIADDSYINRDCVYNWLSFGGATTLRIARGAGAIFFGSIYNIAAPIAGKIMGQCEPSKSSDNATSVAELEYTYLWDGSSWVELLDNSKQDEMRKTLPQMKVTFTPAAINKVPADL
jgi:hypothetical protein